MTKQIRIGYASILLLCTLTAATTKLPDGVDMSLRNFNIELKDKTVCVMWDVLKNQQNLHMLIERSHNGVNFEPVAAKTGYENEDRTFYYYVDANPLAGTSYYKITMSSGAKVHSILTKEIHVPSIGKKY